MSSVTTSNLPASGSITCPGPNPNLGNPLVIVSASQAIENDRRAPRFRIYGGDQGLDPRCYLTFRPTEDQAFRIPCDLVDLNSNGCAIRYRLPRPLPRRAASTMLEIDNLAGSGSVQMLARVHWSRQTGIDQFTSGLSFRRTLPEEFIADAVLEGRITRRATNRTTTEVPVTIRQSQPQLSTDAKIVSSSPTGAQVEASEALAVGARLMLQLADGTAVVGRTVWCTAREDCFASGVAFVNLTTGREFDEAVLRQ